MINKSEKQVVPLLQSLRKTGGWGMNGIVHKNPVGHNTRGIALDKVNIYK